MIKSDLTQLLLINSASTAIYGPISVKKMLLYAIDFSEKIGSTIIVPSHSIIQH